MFDIIESLAKNPIWIGILGGGLIIPPIIGIAFIHNKEKNGEKN